MPMSKALSLRRKGQLPLSVATSIAIIEHANIVAPSAEKVLASVAVRILLMCKPISTAINKEITANSTMSDFMNM